MNFFKRKLLEIANLKTVYGVCKEIEEVENKAKKIFMPSERKKYISNFVDEYNRKNDVEIPQELVDSLYTLGSKVKKGEDYVSIKKYFVAVVLRQVTDLSLKVIFYLIERAVLKL